MPALKSAPAPREGLSELEESDVLNMLYVACPGGSEHTVRYKDVDVETVPIAWGKSFTLADAAVLRGEAAQLSDSVAAHEGNIVYWIHPFYEIRENPNDEEAAYLAGARKTIGELPPDYPVVVFEDRPHLEATFKRLGGMFPGRRFYFIPSVDEGATPDVDLGAAEGRIRKLAETALDEDFFQTKGWRMKRWRIENQGTDEVCAAKWNTLRSFLPGLGVKHGFFAGRKYDTSPDGSWEGACVVRARDELAHIHEKVTVLADTVGPKKPVTRK
ncbi:MAG: hypothetical protein ABH834_01710 [Candidatus Altiarchaeota archaeon]